MIKIIPSRYLEKLKPKNSHSNGSNNGPNNGSINGTKNSTRNGFNEGLTVSDFRYIYILGDGDGRQWMGRQPWGRHHQRIQLCTCRSHYQRQERRYLRHTSCFFEDLLENQMIKQESEVDLRLGSNTGLGVRSPLLIDKF